MSELIAQSFEGTAESASRRIYEFLGHSLMALVDVYVNELAKRRVTDLAPSKLRVVIPARFLTCFERVYVFCA